MNFWRIKWENILTPFVAIGFSVCLVSDTIKYGYDFQIATAFFLVYVLLTSMFYAGVYGGRKDIIENSIYNK